MSTRYLSFREVRIKIENVEELLSNENKKFVTKAKLLTYGKCNTDPLQKYKTNEFVIDDDILIGELIKNIIMNVILDGYTIDEIDNVEIHIQDAIALDKDIEVLLTYP